MNVTVLGGTGRTGRLLVEELLRRGHQVTALVRDPDRAPEHARVVIGDSRDPQALAEALVGAEAVISTLGPARKQNQLHRQTVEQLVPAMRMAGVRRYIGISGAGVDADGDCKSRRDRVISAAMGLFARSLVADKTVELATWQDTELNWTLVRPPRLMDGPATGGVEHDAHVSTRSTGMRRTDLAIFLTDVLDQEIYVRQAPFAATR
ncbi:MULTISPECIES: NAD(P)-dependent oxidoreductase [unclassified Nesterenkonia]|uniref:NAD(P)-dependent oxidoreductase n=1 Tax=unclassified Nesterenkonia TaxID=2629769 RepID=UPI001F4D3473|nr:MULTISPECIES: NAD(P)H-binding protein [unclassified Nesterenkonia]MCH8560632.1 NAD(P)H-binding protein [Nesterenkonia sp. DZ6]MCH8570740.1 NAD(P)H-binding protein [Nesterenkonia sp. AY15]